MSFVLTSSILNDLRHIGHVCARVKLLTRQDRQKTWSQAPGVTGSLYTSKQTQHVYLALSTFASQILFVLEVIFSLNCSSCNLFKFFDFESNYVFIFKVLVYALFLSFYSIYIRINKLIEGFPLMHYNYNLYNCVLQVEFFFIK